AFRRGGQGNRHGVSGPDGQAWPGRWGLAWRKRTPPAAFPSCDQSSFRIVPLPRRLENNELTLLLNRSRKNVSFASFLLSPLTSMVMAFHVSPGAKVSVPDLAT